MPIIVPQCGDKLCLAGLIAQNVLYKVHLYKNNYTPTHTDLQNCSNYTIADFSGYSGPTIITWSAPGINGNSQGQIIGSSITWTKSGATGNTIYGAFIQDISGNLICAERFTTSIPMTADGNQCTYNPIFSAVSEV